MLRIDKDKEVLSRLEHVTMQKAGYWETRDLQSLICRNPDHFRDELGEDIWLVGAETRPSDASQNRIDLLGVDSEGVTVVIELKRDSHKLQLLQSLTYAAMIADWAPVKFAEALAGFNAKFRGNSQSLEEAQGELAEMLDEGDVDSINRRQRIVLLAEHFDYEVLATAGWLSKNYNVDIRCYRLELAKLDGSLFLTCTNAYPPPELKEIAVRRQIKSEGGISPPLSWEEVFSRISNQSVVTFFKNELESGRRGRPEKSRISYDLDNRKPFRLSAKQNFAGVFQAGRFQGDIEFWKSSLGPLANVRSVSNAKALRFRLSSDDDFAFFKENVTDILANVSKTNLAELSADEDSELD